MARWKAHVEFLLSVSELLFLSLTVEELQGKMCQTSLLSGGVGQFEPRFHGKGRPWGIFLVSTKLDAFCYPTVQTAPCRRFHTIPACGGRTDGQTDGQTDGRNCRS